MTHRLSESGILLKELHDAIGELWVVADKGLDLVQGDEDPQKKLLVLVLQREGKTVDNAAENLKQLSCPIMVLCFIDKPEAVDTVRQNYNNERVDKQQEYLSTMGLFEPDANFERIIDNNHTPLVLVL